MLIPREKQDELVAALIAHSKNFYPEGALKSSSYGRIVTRVHHSRLKGLLERTKGTVAAGGRVDDEKGFEPTIVRDVQENDVLLDE